VADSDVRLVPGQVRVEAWDLCVDAKDRRKTATPHRRALVHDFDDGLTVNWANDYPNGVTLKGVRTIEGQNLGPTTKTEFKHTVDLRGFVECFSTLRFIANPTTWTQIAPDDQGRLVFESKGLPKPKEMVFETEVLAHQVGLNGQLHILLNVKPGGTINRAPPGVSDAEFAGTAGTSLETVFQIAGQTNEEVAVKVDAVDAIATLAETVLKLQAEVQALKAQLGDSQGNWRWCKKCQGLFYAGSPPATNKKPCAAGGDHSQEGSADYRLLT
jgi:hypothetical protein